MDKAYGDRSITNCRGHAPYCSLPYITGSEYARHARFQVKRIALENPACGAFPVFDEFLASGDEAGTIALDDSFEHVCMRDGSDKYK